MKTRIKPILTLLFVLTSVSLFAQSIDGKTPGVSKKTVVRINFLGVPAFNFEKSLGGSFTFRPEAGLGWPLITDNENTAGKHIIKMEYAVNPYVLLEGRYYYNLNRRFEKGCRTDYFAADYVAVYYRYNAYEYQAGFSDHNRDDNGVLLRDVQYMGAWWGIQRNLGKNQRFYINWSLGPGIKTNCIDYVDFSFTTQLGLGVQW